MVRMFAFFLVVGFGRVLEAVVKPQSRPLTGGKSNQSLSPVGLFFGG